MTRASAWIAPLRLAPDSSASTLPPCRSVRIARAPALTICCCSCITCRTRTCSIPARPSSSPSTIRTTTAPTASPATCGLEGAQGTDRRATLSGGARQLKYQAGQAIVWRDAVTTGSFAPPASPTPRPRRNLSRSPRSGIGSSGLVRRQTRHAVGNGVGWPGRGMRCRVMHRNLHL